MSILAIALKKVFLGKDEQLFLLKQRNGIIV